MDKWIATVVITTSVILAGIGLLFGVGVVVQQALVPVTGSLQNISSVQKEILQKQDGTASGDVKNVLARLSALEAKVQALEARGPVAPPAPSRQRPQRDLSRVYDIPVGSSAVFGKAQAPVTIVMFNDFQCPFCSRFYPAALEAAKAYPDKVKLVMKHFPLSFHKDAPAASKAALAAGVQGKFYEMSELLFQNTRSLNEEKFKELAAQLKLNVNKFMKDLKERDAEWEKIIAEDIELGRKSDVGGTPSFYLNGKISGARDVEGWKAQIDAILSGKPIPEAAAPQGAGGGC